MAIRTKRAKAVLNGWEQAHLTAMGIHSLVDFKGLRTRQKALETAGKGEGGAESRPGRQEMLHHKARKAKVGWPTASSRDWKDTPGMSEKGINPDGALWPNCPEKCFGRARSPLRYQDV